MPLDLRFPLYALADAQTAKTVFGGHADDRRLLLFTSAENASRYRARMGLIVSVVKLREPNDLRILLRQQVGEAAFGVEIDPEGD